MALLLSLAYSGTLFKFSFNPKCRFKLLLVGLNTRRPRSERGIISYHPLLYETQNRKRKYSVVACDAVIFLMPQSSCAFFSFHHPFLSLYQFLLPLLPSVFPWLVSYRAQRALSFAVSPDFLWFSCGFGGKKPH